LRSYITSESGDSSPPNSVRSKIMNLRRFGYALITGTVAAVLLAACSEPQPPVGSPGAMPQSLAPPAAIKRSTQATHAAAEETVLHSFGGSDGAGPIDGMVAGKAGTFYGTTTFGGIGAGAVFQLTPSASGYTESVLYDFKSGYDGARPQGVILHDGALYGDTLEGGSPNGNGGLGWGTVFKLTRGKSGYTESVLYRFLGFPDAWEPNGPIVIDQRGSIYGSSGFGGAENAGAIFKLTPSQSGYTESVLYSFPGGVGGDEPQAGLTIDAHGAIYGTTMYGGNDQGLCYGYNCGLVFKLTPGTSAYSERIIYAFQGSPDGMLPYGALSVEERTGAVFGTTYWGGTMGDGSLFELKPRGSSYAEKVLHSFTGKADGFLPEGTPLLTSNGAIYGTAALGGGGCHGIGCGTVFELTPSHAGYSFHVVYDFRHPITGAEPQQTNLLSDASGALYGTTRSGGSATSCSDGGPGGARGCGVVFKITP
jgi:uncharacterized repeat protein (TIGR03803 family)